MTMFCTLSMSFILRQREHFDVFRLNGLHNAVDKYARDMDAIGRK